MIISFFITLFFLGFFGAPLAVSGCPRGPMWRLLAALWGPLLGSGGCSWVVWRLFLGPYTIQFGFRTFYFRCFLLAPYLFLKFSFGLNISLCGVTAKLFCAPHGLLAVRCATMAVGNHGRESAPLTRTHLCRGYRSIDRNSKIEILCMLSLHVYHDTLPDYWNTRRRTSATTKQTTVELVFIVKPNKN